MTMNRFLNPFGYLSLRKTLCWGIAALIVTSIFVWQTGLRLSSLTQVNFAGDALWMATARQVVVWLLFAVVLYIAGVLLSPSKIRFWDVAADNLFARIPFDLSLLIFAVPRWRSVLGLVADGSIIAAGAVVLSNSKLEPGVYAGVPAKKVKDGTDAVRQSAHRNAQGYMMYKEWFLEDENSNQQINI